SARSVGETSGDNIASVGCQRARRERLAGKARLAETGLTPLASLASKSRLPFVRGLGKMGAV
ncbi:MAG TPA: hypothetical protein VJT11_10535, partial [Nitrospiraceae bacterium]|nr:hypothetical protein [Nitrospiraceae bacterium]